MKVAQSCLTLYRPHGLYGPWNSSGQNTGVGSLFLLQGIFPTEESNWDLFTGRFFTSWATKALKRESKVKRSRSVMSNSLRPMDCSLSGSSIHGIFQARVLEWIAISFSRGSSRPRNGTRDSRIAGGRFTVWATREAPGWAVPYLGACSIWDKKRQPTCTAWQYLKVVKTPAIKLSPTFVLQASSSHC